MLFHTPSPYRGPLTVLILCSTCAISVIARESFLWVYSPPTCPFPHTYTPPPPCTTGGPGQNTHSNKQEGARDSKRYTQSATYTLAAIGQSRGVQSGGQIQPLSPPPPTNQSRGHESTGGLQRKQANTMPRSLSLLWLPSENEQHELQHK